MTFSGSYWRPDQDEEIIRSAKAAARIRYQRASLIEDLKQREAEAKWAISSESRQKIDAALKLARSETGIADAGNNWNSDPMLLARRGSWGHRYKIEPKGVLLNTNYEGVQMRKPLKPERHRLEPGTGPSQRILHKQAAHMAIQILPIREKLA